jgi:HAD superfamily hydrolase (TIGR01509 family)
MIFEAVVFDVDGTLAETEEIHRQAFNEAFAAVGLPWVWDEALYEALLKVTGGKERILHYAARHRPEELDAIRPRVPEIHRVKTERYGALVDAGALGLRPGVARLVAEASAAGLKLAIATTTTRANVAALLGRALPLSGRRLFAVIAAGDEVAAKKPAPDVYALAVERLGLRAEACLAIEDSYNGVASARAAGLSVIATPSLYTAGDRFDGALSVVSDLGEPDRPHRHLAGRDWPGGYVSLAALRDATPETVGTGSTASA